MELGRIPDFVEISMKMYKGENLFVINPTSDLLNRSEFPECSILNLCENAKFDGKSSYKTIYIIVAVATAAMVNSANELKLKIEQNRSGAVVEIVLKK